MKPGSAARFFSAVVLNRSPPASRNFPTSCFSGVSCDVWRREPRARKEQMSSVFFFAVRSDLRPLYFGTSPAAETAETSRFSYKWKRRNRNCHTPLIASQG
ncbi:hypothetical protein NQZ68_015735 [Dissostichus eleginoides]|nr:hypothetical protein NQZ68_015735 [Dissostichus eleginoides]